MNESPLHHDPAEPLGSPDGFRPEEFRRLAEQNARDDDQPLDAQWVLQRGRTRRRQRRAVALVGAAAVVSGGVVGVQALRPHQVGLPAAPPSVLTATLPTQVSPSGPAPQTSGGPAPRVSGGPVPRVSGGPSPAPASVPASAPDAPTPVVVSASTGVSSAVPVRAPASAAAVCRVGLPRGQVLGGSPAVGEVEAVAPDGGSYVQAQQPRPQHGLRLTWHRGGTQHLIDTVSDGDAAAAVGYDGRWVVYRLYMGQDLFAPGTFRAWDSQHPDVAPITLGSTVRDDDTAIQVNGGVASFVTRASVDSGRAVLHQVDLASRHDVTTDAGPADAAFEGPMPVTGGTAWGVRVSSSSVQLHAVTSTGAPMELPWRGSSQWAWVSGGRMASVSASGDVWGQDATDGRLLVAGSSAPGRFSSASFDGRHLLVSWTTANNDSITRLYDLQSGSWAGFAGGQYPMLDNGWVRGVPNGSTITRADLPGC